MQELKKERNTEEKEQEKDSSSQRDRKLLGFTQPTKNKKTPVWEFFCEKIYIFNYLIFSVIINCSLGLLTRQIEILGRVVKHEKNPKCRVDFNLPKNF